MSEKELLLGMLDGSILIFRAFGEGGEGGGSVLHICEACTFWCGDAPPQDSLFFCLFFFLFFFLHNVHIDEIGEND